MAVARRSASCASARSTIPRRCRRTCTSYTRSKLPWVRLPEGVPAFDAYYDMKALWPAASLERRRAILG